MSNNEEELLQKYLQGNCTPEEKAIVENWYLRSSASMEDTLPEPNYERLKTEIWNALPPNRGGSVLTLRIAAVAASVILIVGLYFIAIRKPATPGSLAKTTDIAPGSNQATLTLANGRKITLTSHLNGTLAQQGNTVVKVDNGKAISYTAAGNDNAADEVVYNTLSTARGQQSPYPLILADGTRVWLDAASTITFPTTFKGKERLVKVTGEVYFEVTHHAAQPFKVKVKQQTIEDIGTMFNINAYDDEASIKTTLVEGSIKVSSPEQEAILKPGQQAEQFAGHHDMVLHTVNVDDILAWKNNYFSFDGDNLESILRRVSRWYDVDIVYENPSVKNKFFGGTVSRFAHVSSVLKTLELTRAAHFKLEGRKIIVTQ
ncbi:FecR family protein [Mucilaginibacter sp. 22184]|uniref:FecR family protein n=1 Tax=Mucilaginibacter sp. 22184 TaxID=3453887 RepID=UPI003F8615F3